MMNPQPSQQGGSNPRWPFPPIPIAALGTSAEVAKQLQAYLLPEYDLVHVSLTPSSAALELPTISAHRHDAAQPRSGLGSNAERELPARLAPRAIVCGADVAEDDVLRVMAAVKMAAPGVVTLHVTKQEVLTACRVEYEMRQRATLVQAQALANEVKLLVKGLLDAKVADEGGGAGGGTGGSGGTGGAGSRGGRDKDAKKSLTPTAGQTQAAAVVLSEIEEATAAVTRATAVLGRMAQVKASLAREHAQNQNQGQGGSAEAAGGNGQAAGGNGQTAGGNGQAAGQDAQAAGQDAQAAGQDAQAAGQDAQDSSSQGAQAIDQAAQTTRQGAQAASTSQAAPGSQATSTPQATSTSQAPPTSDAARGQTYAAAAASLRNRPSAQFANPSQLAEAILKINMAERTGQPLIGAPAPEVIAWATKIRLGQLVSMGVLN